MANKIKVYILVKDKKAVYVGCTCNIKMRIAMHKVQKNFDDYIILKEYDKKEDALCAENAIIRFLSIFDYGGNYNAKYEILSHLKDQIDGKAVH